MRIALFGAGKMAEKHAAAIRTLPEAELVGIADPNVNVDDVHARFGADVAVFHNPVALLDDCRPDVVHIVTPPNTHVALARQCVERGVHVYVEKPFAPTVAEAEHLLQLAEGKGAKVCPAHQVLFQRSGQRCRRYVPIIGDVVHVESYFSFKPVRRRPDGGTPGSAVDQLIDILPHPVYLLLSAFGAEQLEAIEISGLDVNAEGEVRAIIKLGDALATLTVSLRARPVESYLKVVGTNGSVQADFILGSVVKHLGPGASAPAVVLKPFSAAIQTAWGSFVGLARLVFGRQKSYPGLAELLDAFYTSVRSGSEPPIDRRAVLATVRICEEIGERLKQRAEEEELIHQRRLTERERLLAPADRSRGVVLVTGGSGFLGRIALQHLRRDGFVVRALCRSIPNAKRRVPGVEYTIGDLSKGLPGEALDNVRVVVHLAAETAGNQAAHERNTKVATKNLLDAMTASGVKRLVNISSVAVLRPGDGTSPLREDSPVDRGNLGRGPYVWAKAEAEAMAAEYASSIVTRTIRLGPLVDFENYTAPGRLGREVARLYVAVGSGSSTLSVCDVHTAANVIRSYVADFDHAPPCVNLVEVPAPTRRQLVDRLRATRPDLKFMWLPFPVLKVLSVLAIGLQRLLRPKNKPLDLYAAFKSEHYDSTLAQTVIDRAGTGTREPLRAAS